jgi:hypothetical protein
VLDREEHEPQNRILRALNQWHRNAFADLTGVVDAEPLVGEVSAAIDHELRTEHPSERPPGDQRRHECVSEEGQRTSGPPPSLQVETDRQR